MADASLMRKAMAKPGDLHTPKHARWTPFARLRDPGCQYEASTTRKPLLTVIGRRTRHAEQSTSHVASARRRPARVRAALTPIGRFPDALMSNAGQLLPRGRCHCIRGAALLTNCPGRHLKPHLTPA